MDMGSQGHGMTRDPARDRMNRPLPREPFDPFEPLDPRDPTLIEESTLSDLNLEDPALLPLE